MKTRNIDSWYFYENNCYFAFWCFLKARPGSHSQRFRGLSQRLDSSSCTSAQDTSCTSEIHLHLRKGTCEINLHASIDAGWSGPPWTQITGNERFRDLDAQWCTDISRRDLNDSLHDPSFKVVWASPARRNSNSQLAMKLGITNRGNCIGKVKSQCPPITPIIGWAMEAER